MANAPKMEDFPTITKWLEALKKYGDAERGAKASNNISSSLKKPSGNTKTDPNKYDRSTQYTRFRSGPPVRPNLKYSIKDWKAIPKSKREKMNKDWRNKLYDWTEKQEKSGGLSRQSNIDSINVDRMSIGLGSLSNTELARLISRRSYKHTLQYPQILQEFENRRAKGDTTIDEVLKTETKEYKDWRAKNPPKYTFRNNKGGVIKNKSKSRTGHTDYRSKGMIHSTKVKRG